LPVRGLGQPLDWGKVYPGAVGDPDVCGCSVFGPARIWSGGSVMSVSNMTAAKAGKGFHGMRPSPNPTEKSIVGWLERRRVHWLRAHLRRISESSDGRTRVRLLRYALRCSMGPIDSLQNRQSGLTITCKSMLATASKRTAVPKFAPNSHDRALGLWRRASRPVSLHGRACQFQIATRHCSPGQLRVGVQVSE